MRRTKHIDPFEENEELASRDIEDSNYKFMKKKAVLQHNSSYRKQPDKISVFKKTSCLEVQIETWQQILQVSNTKCDEGHFHQFVHEEPLWFERINIPWPQAKRLARWILDMEEV